MRREKLQQYIFIFLLILLPTQLGLHFWPSWSYVNGIRVDYLSPTLYATDILILLMFLLEIPRIKLGQLGQLGIFGLLVLINIYFSLSPAVSVYKWLKVAELGFLVWWVARRCSSNLLSYLPTLLLVPVLYESILVIWQFASQSSIGGLWYWFGERVFNSSTPGIANAYINGQLVLRPYGTFSHPNVLGGFLAIVLPLTLWEFLHNSRKLTARTFGGLSAVVVGYVALFLSMSRAAILVGIGATLVVLWQKLGRSKIWLEVLGSLALLGVVLWPRLMALRTETEPIVARQQLNSVAVGRFVHSPVWGQGLGTSPLSSALSTMNPELRTFSYALAFQPPHNIYLLLLSETGMVGFLAFGYLVVQAWRRAPPIIHNSLAIILLLGLFDHYFLTLQQGQLIFSLILGLAFVRMKKAQEMRR